MSGNPWLSKPKPEPDRRGERLKLRTPKVRRGTPQDSRPHGRRRSKNGGYSRRDAETAENQVTYQSPNSCFHVTQSGMYQSDETNCAREWRVFHVIRIDGEQETSFNSAALVRDSGCKPKAVFACKPA